MSQERAVVNRRQKTSRPGSLETWTYIKSRYGAKVYMLELKLIFDKHLPPKMVERYKTEYASSL